MNRKEDVDLQSFVSAEDPTDCTLVVAGGKFIKRFPEVLKRIDGKGWRNPMVQKQLSGKCQKK